MNLFEANTDRQWFVIDRHRNLRPCTSEAHAYSWARQNDQDGLAVVAWRDVTWGPITTTEEPA